jgi:hypothetical protein
VPRELNILDIDTECLPGHWIGGDFVSKIFTAVAFQWIGKGGVPAVYTHYEYTSGELAVILAKQVEEADYTTGHYIRGFDLPLLNGNLQLNGSPLFRQVMSHDTKLDLIKSHGRSLSQKNLAALIGVAAPKIEVTLAEWEGFNTKDPRYKAKGIERVQGDVIQNIEMRAKLIELDWIGPPEMWIAKQKTGGYRP